MPTLAPRWQYVKVVVAALHSLCQQLPACARAVKQRITNASAVSLNAEENLWLAIAVKV
jgi:hypothetical protein